MGLFDKIKKGIDKVTEPIVPIVTQPVQHIVEPIKQKVVQPIQEKVVEPIVTTTTTVAKLARAKIRTSDKARYSDGARENERRRKPEISRIVVPRHFTVRE